MGVIIERKLVLNAVQLLEGVVDLNHVGKDGPSKESVVDFLKGATEILIARAGGVVAVANATNVVPFGSEQSAVAIAARVAVTTAHATEIVRGVAEDCSVAIAARLTITGANTANVICGSTVDLVTAVDTKI